MNTEVAAISPPWASHDGRVDLSYCLDQIKIQINKLCWQFWPSLRPEQPRIASKLFPDGWECPFLTVLPTWRWQCARLYVALQAHCSEVRVRVNVNFFCSIVLPPASPFQFGKEFLETFVPDVLQTQGRATHKFSVLWVCNDCSGDIGKRCGFWWGFEKI